MKLNWIIRREKYKFHQKKKIYIYIYILHKATYESMGIQYNICGNGCLVTPQLF